MKKQEEKQGKICMDYCPQGKDPKICKFCKIWCSYPDE